MQPYLEIQYIENGHKESISPFIQLRTVKEGVMVYNGRAEYLIKTEDLHTIKVVYVNKKDE